MMRLKSASLARDYGALFGTGTLAGLGDATLLERFLARRDEVAFEELLARHGPVVLGICRRWLDDPRDIEDAFQATFLILIRKAAGLRDRNALSCWLYGVALRVVRRARANAMRRHIRERTLVCVPADRARTTEECIEDEALTIVDEEIRRLPENQQLAVILCLKEGYTHEAAARELGWPLGTVKSRIAAARQTLTRRLTRRGLAPSGAMAMLHPGLTLGEPTSAITSDLVRLTLETARESLANSSMPAAGTSATVAGLVREVLRIMLVTRIRSAALVLMALGTLAWAVPTLLSARPAGQEERTASRLQAAPVAAARPSQPPMVDRYGDPLPPGAAMRLGTVRFRQAPSFRHIAYSPDGRLVVTYSGQRRLLVRDATDGKEVRRIDLGIENGGDFDFSPDGTSIIGVGFRLDPGRNAVANQLTIADVATGRPVRRGEWDEQQSVEKVAYAPDGRTIATVSLDGVLRVWDSATLKLLRQDRLIREGNRDTMAFSTGAASRLLAITAREPNIDIWDVAQVRRVRTIANDRAYRPDALVFSPDGKTLAAGVASRGVEIRQWNVGDGTLIRRFQTPKDTQVNDMAFSPDGRALAAIGSGHALVFFDTTTGKPLELLPGIGLADYPLAFSPDGKTLATTGDRQTLHFWDLATGADRLATPEDHQGEVAALSGLADGNTLVSGSRDRTARIWDLATGRSRKSLVHDGWVDSLAVSADGSLLATGSAYPVWGRVRVWNLRTGAPVFDWSIEAAKAGLHMLRGVTISEDGSAVIAALSDGSLRRWDVSTGKERPIARPDLEKLPAGPMPDGLDGVNRAVFSRDGRSVALIGRGYAQVMDVASGARRFKEAATGPCEFAPDGESLAVVREGPGKAFQAGRWQGSSFGTSTITWLDSRTGQVRRQIEIPESLVKALAFSPGGQAIAVGTLLSDPTRGIIRIFRLRDKREIQTIEAPCPWIGALGFTRDGQRIVAGLLDTSIVIWDVRAIE
jgi:RNA polymerase sigma factor (sigma-70 family)